MSGQYIETCTTILFKYHNEFVVSNIISPVVFSKIDIGGLKGNLIGNDVILFLLCFFICGKQVQ